MNECILDEIAHVIKVLTNRPDLKISGSYNENQNRILSVQINANKKPIPDESLVVIRELYNLRSHKILDTRKKGYTTLGKSIRYLMSVNRIRLGLIL